MPQIVVKADLRVDRRSPQSESDKDSPILRENLLSRDGVNRTVGGTSRVITNLLTDRATWLERYHSIETGVISPKSFAYTKDGKLWHVDEDGEVATELRSDLNQNAFPKSWMFKTQTQTIMYLVDGKDLWKYDGNNDLLWVKIAVNIDVIDIIEHKDRSILISKAFVLISKNLFFDDFTDSTDTIQLIIGSGKGENLAQGKLEDRLFFFNTEGIFGLFGDTISALAPTFEIRQVDERKIIAGRSLAKVENALVFLASDYNIWSWNGSTTTKLSHKERLEDFINKKADFLKKAVGTWEDNYYKLSFVEDGHSENELEAWWDTFPNRKGENNIDFVRGRNVAYYSQFNPTIEEEQFQFCRSDINMIMWANRGRRFDGVQPVQRLRTRDIGSMGDNLRFTEFFAQVEPTGTRELRIHYFLDGRSSNLGDKAFFDQNLRGETKGIGELQISNQAQFTDRIRPLIAFSRGSSIAFYINDQTDDMLIALVSIGFNFIGKGQKKGKLIGR